MKKRLFCLALAIVMLFAVAGCGNNGGGSGNKGGDTNTHQGFELTEADGVSGDIFSIKKPTRELDSKKLTLYTWVDEESVYSSIPKLPSVADIITDENGVEITVNTVSQENYWQNLATLIAGGSSPDLVQVPNWDYYPVGITSGCLQPLDDIINFDKPLWEQGKEARESIRWIDGKIYYPTSGVGSVQKWLFFNKALFVEAGLKTPYEHFKEGTWCFDTLKDMCVKLKKEENGEVTQWPLLIQSNSLIASAGVEIVELDRENKTYKLNLRHENVAKVMNFLHELGRGGLDVLGGTPSDFRQQRLAMITTDYWCATSEFNKIRLAGNLGWVPMPSIEKGGKVYQLATAPGASYAMVKGAKNVNEAALFLEIDAWKSLSNSKYGVPMYIDFDKPYYRAYEGSAEADQPDKSKWFTDEEAEMSKTMGLDKLPYVTFGFQSWLGTSELGQIKVTDYGQQWSAVLEELEPTFKATCDSYFE